MIGVNMQQETAKFISISKAGEELGVSRTTMYYYIEQLAIQVKKFPLDRKTYISLVDLENIKAAKKAGEEGRR
jgi:biotin operon repressor